MGVRREVMRISVKGNAENKASVSSNKTLKFIHFPKETPTTLSSRT